MEINTQLESAISSDSFTYVIPSVKIKKSPFNYSNEKQLEDQFIDLLVSYGYEKLEIKGNTEENKKILLDNLRNLIQKLNNTTYTDIDWKIIKDTYLLNSDTNPIDRIKLIQEDRRISITSDDGTIKNIMLIDDENWSRNYFQVIHQFRGSDHNRYDVTILINGFPMIQIELKNKHINIKEAFGQIQRYSRDSFNEFDGLFSYLQLFVISNGNETKYFSNMFANTKTKTSENPYTFTSYWADEKNNLILELPTFSESFFNRKSIFEIITKYSILDVDKNFKVMRPYQICATERVLRKIFVSHENKLYGTKDAGGYIWHTTGSGKTLESFKTAQLATTLTDTNGKKFIDKVLFVVDRKDLDNQTSREYNKFKKDSTESCKNTAALKKHLEDPESRIIVTTIQKLSIFIKQNPNHSIYDKEVLIIFDECHRSQFGDMNDRIRKSFKKYYIYGYTGTPIFAENANGLQTTDSVFGKRIHDYTIISAIQYGSVLPFRVSYIGEFNTIKPITEQQVEGIDISAIFNSNERISNITKYIIKHYKQEVREGFNSIFATESISTAKKYYNEFKKQNSKLKVGIIFSYQPNDQEAVGTIVDENIEDTDRLKKTDFEFLQNAIDDYNKTFNTSHTLYGKDGFQNYYDDISLRLKNRELDILIVVNMFLTGFDAKTLSTLWVDKNLQYHGLIQAFSRTNRILNNEKQFGNIICFRNLDSEVKDAIGLFGNENAASTILLKSFSEYYNGFNTIDPITEEEIHYDGYVELVDEIKNKKYLSLCVIDNSFDITNREKDFVKVFNKLLQRLNILRIFNEFNDNNKILTDDEIFNMKLQYSKLYSKVKEHHKYSKVNVNDEIIFDTDLAKTVQDINIDYIINVVNNTIDSETDADEKIKIRSKAINDLLEASFKLKSKKQLIQDFINATKINTSTSWDTFKKENLDKEIDSLIKLHNLNENETKKFITSSINNENIKNYGSSYQSCFKPKDLFDDDYENDQENTFEKMLDIYEKYLGE